MSFYNHICAVCPDKRFIEPGTETSAVPRHVRSLLDEQHPAVPIDLRGEQAQRKMLARLLDIVRAAAPTAVSIDLETSDQDAYGFVLKAVTDAHGTNLLPEGYLDSSHPLWTLDDAVADELGDLEWDGVVGEDEGGYATISLLAAQLGDRG